MKQGTTSDPEVPAVSIVKSNPLEEEAKVDGVHNHIGRDRVKYAGCRGADPQLLRLVELAIIKIGKNEIASEELDGA